MTLHLGMTNKGSDMGGRTWDCVCDVSVKIRCPRDPGVGICAWLCVYGFGIIQIVVYNVGGCYMGVVINPGEVDCFCGCVMNFMMFLVYIWDNNQDIITCCPFLRSAFHILLLLITLSHASLPPSVHVLDWPQIWPVVYAMSGQVPMSAYMRDPMASP